MSRLATYLMMCALIAGCAFGQTKPEPVTMFSGGADTKRIEGSSNTFTYVKEEPGKWKAIASQDGDGHWHLVNGHTLDELVEFLNNQSFEQQEQCQSDKDRIFAEWKKSLDSISGALTKPAKSVTTPKKPKPIKKPLTAPHSPAA
jgi:hypothetical protein